MSGGYLAPLLPPGTWCTRCGARPGIAGPAWICRVCVAGGPHKRIVRNDGRRPRRPVRPVPVSVTARPDCATVAAPTGTAPTGSTARAAGAPVGPARPAVPAPGTARRGCACSAAPTETAPTGCAARAAGGA